MTVIHNLLHNEAFVLGCFAVIIFGLTQLAKIPIKHFTSRIKVERTRRMVNATILLIPFALGIAFQALFAVLYLKEGINVIVGLEYGTAGISVYGILERFLKIDGNKANPYNTDNGKAVKEFIANITADGIIDEKDKTYVEQFWAKISKR